MPRSTPDWPGILSDLQQQLREILFQIDQSERQGLEAHVTTMDALDSLDSWLNVIKRDLGV